MNQAQKLLVGAAIVSGLGVGALGVGTTFAAASTNAEDPMQNLVEAIAEKFNLDVDEVQEVFDEQRAQMEADHAQREAGMLAQAVADGKLTQTQADALTQKRSEMKTFMKSLASLDKDERRDAMKAKMDELKAWAEENDIPFFLMGPGGEHRGMHRPGDEIPAQNE